MKQILIKIQLAIVGILLSFSLSAQMVSTTDQVLTGTDFGTTILVPINTSDITATYGNIIIATIRIEYDPSILTYTGYSSLNPGIPSNVSPYFTVNPAGVGGVVQFNIEDPLFAGFPFPNGKLLDIEFTYNGGYSALEITDSEFLTELFATEISPVTNGSVTGFADITGSTGSWNVAGTWTGPMGSLTQPGPGHNVTITTGLSPVTVDAAGMCNSVTIASGGKLTVNTGVTLTVAEDLTVQSGGSFIPVGTLAVTGTKSVEREITAANWSAPGQGYHILSSPVIDQALNGNADFAPTGAGNDYDFYAWDEVTQYWFNQKNPAHTAMFVTFDEGKGYLAAYQMTDTKVFSGEFNVANISKTGLTKSGYTDDGWHMLGNPFPSAVIWGGAEWAYSNIAANAKVWNSAGGAYIDIVPTGKIPACNGFMVEATLTNASLTIPAAKRDHGSTTWYKSAEMYIKLVAHDIDNGLAQESNIRFNEAATEGYESEFDSHFLGGYAPEFYSMAGSDKVSTNTLPSLVLNEAIPFTFIKNASSNFSIELVESIESNVVFLKDKKTGNMVNLSENGSYTFGSEVGDDPERFEIHFGVLGIDTPNSLAVAHVYAAKDKLYVANVNGKTSMDILNSQGQMLNSFAFDGSGNDEFAVSLPTGIYLVRLNNSNATRTVKVFIQ